jgi:hypothetical protein
MALSFAQAQQVLLNASGLDPIGDNRNDLGVSLDRTNSAVIRAAARFVIDARDNLQKADKISSGHLESSIQPKLVQFNNGVTIIDIYVANYYKFVDKGVMGWADRKGSGSEYKFKKGSGKRGTGAYNPLSNPMVLSIRKWLIKENRAFRNTKVAVTAREHKRAKIVDTSTATASRIAFFVKRHGIEKTNFWADALRELEKDIATGVASALRLDVIETFSSFK